MQNNHEQKLDGEVHLWLYVFFSLDGTDSFK